MIVDYNLSPNLLPSQCFPQKKRLTSFHLLHVQIALDLTEDEKHQLENMEYVETRYNCLGAFFFPSAVILWDLLPASCVVSFIFSSNFLLIVNDD